MNENRLGWQRAKPVNRVYVNDESKNNILTHDATLSNQIEKEVNALASDICVTNKANYNLTHSQKELLRWNFRLGHIGFQHVQWLILTRRLKVQRNFKAVAK